MVWLLCSLIFPVLVALLNGSTYFFSFSVVGVGVIFYLLNVFLIRRFIVQSAPKKANDVDFESTAGMGIVPKWVSIIGLIGLGFIPSGFLVTLLLFFNLIENRF